MSWGMSVPTVICSETRHPCLKQVHNPAPSPKQELVDKRCGAVFRFLKVLLNYSSRKKNTLMIVITPNPIRMNPPTSVQETCVSLMIQMAIGIEQKKAKLRMPCQIRPRKINDAPLDRPMATMMPGHHQPV